MLSLQGCKLRGYQRIRSRTSRASPGVGLGALEGGSIPRHNPEQLFSATSTPIQRTRNDGVKMPILIY
jgi:hypothetical protein